MPLGFLVSVAVALPNISFMLRPPISLPTTPMDNGGITHRVMEVMEKIGQVSSFGIPIFCRIHVQNKPEIAAFVVMLACLAFYYIGWVRYFIKNRNYAQLFCPLLGIPLPMAISPVLFFLSASVVLHSIYLAVASIVFGIGHLYISSLERQRSRC